MDTRGGRIRRGGELKKRFPDPRSCKKTQPPLGCDAVLWMMQRVKTKEQFDH
jgi:hypothetical protein